MIKKAEIDVLEAGRGPLVVLMHSSVSGARQWRRLSEDLAIKWHVMAVNLFGYGRTPAWTATRPQTLADQAALIKAVVPDGAQNIALVGHSFGGSVAMRVAADLGKRVSRVVLIEPNPFTVLRDHGRVEAFAEIVRLRDIVKRNGEKGEWAAAAEQVRRLLGRRRQLERNGTRASRRIRRRAETELPRVGCRNERNDIPAKLGSIPPEVIAGHSRCKHRAADQGDRCPNQRDDTMAGDDHSPRGPPSAVDPSRTRQSAGCRFP